MSELLKKESSSTSQLEYYQNEIENIEAELESTHANGAKDSLSKIKFLIENENKLSKEINEHEKKEFAFRETLAEADVIMANIEFNYTTKVKDLEEKKLASDLKNEIKDQEDLMAQMESMELENKSLNQNLSRLKEIEFKHQELQQSEDFLHGRVEELEQTENSLRETISIIEQNFVVKEKKMQDQISRLREEIQHQNHSASNYEDAYDR